MTALSITKTALDSVKNVQAEMGQNSNILSWDPTPDTTKIVNIYRSEINDRNTAIKVGSAQSANTYIDGLIEPGKTYYYWTKAVDEDNDEIGEWDNDQNAGLSVTAKKIASTDIEDDALFLYKSTVIQTPISLVTPTTSFTTLIEGEAMVLPFDTETFRYVESIVTVVFDFGDITVDTNSSFLMEVILHREQYVDGFGWVDVGPVTKTSPYKAVVVRNIGNKILSKISDITYSTVTLELFSADNTSRFVVKVKPYFPTGSGSFDVEIVGSLIQKISATGTADS